MEHTVIELLLDGGRAAGVLAYDRERGRFHVVHGQGGRPGDRRRRPRLQDHQQQLGRHRRRPRAGLSRRRRADRHGVHPVPSDRDGLAAERAGHPRHRRRARRRRRPARTAKAAASCSTTSPTTTSRRPRPTPEEGWRYTQGDKSARRPPELLTRDHVARCINREVQGRPRHLRTAACSSTSRGSRRSCQDAEEHIKRKLPSMYHQFKELADLDITKEPMEVGPDDALHHGRHPRRRRHADVDDSRACSRPASARRASTAPTASAATRCRT